MSELLLVVAALVSMLGLWSLLVVLPWARSLDVVPCRSLCMLYALHPRIAMALTEPDVGLEEMLDVVLLALERDGLAIPRPIIRVSGPLIPESTEGAASMKLYGFIVLTRSSRSLPAGKLLFIVAHEVGHLLFYHYRGGHWLLDALQGGEEVRADAIGWLVARSVICHAEGRDLDRGQLVLDMMPALLARAQGICPVSTTAL